jgi:hypothetical protein
MEGQEGGLALAPALKVDALKVMKFGSAIVPAMARVMGGHSCVCRRIIVQRGVGVMKGEGLCSSWLDKELNKKSDSLETNHLISFQIFSEGRILILDFSMCFAEMFATRSLWTVFQGTRSFSASKPIICDNRYSL